MKYLIISFLLLIVLIFACASPDVDQRARRVIDYFVENPSRLHNFMGLQIVPRGTDTYIYGIDSLEIGLYLTNFSIDNPSSLQISNQIFVDSLLIKRGIKHLNSFKKITLESAHGTISLMKRFNIESINSCITNDLCCLEFILVDRLVIGYICDELGEHEKLKKAYGNKIKIVNQNWFYFQNNEE